MNAISNREKCAEARREAALRRKVYPGFVERKMITSKAADRQIALMDAIAADYAVLAEHDERGERLL
jgi:hypothetical protein